MSRLVKSIPRSSRPRAEQSSHYGDQHYDEETIPNEAFNEALMREHHLANKISQMRHSLYADEVGIRQSYTCSESDESCSTAAELSRFEDCDDQDNDVDEEDITNYIRRNFQADYDVDESDSSDIRRYASRSDNMEESDSDEDIRYASRSDYLMNYPEKSCDSSSQSSCVEERFLSQSAPDMSESDDAYAPIRGVGRSTIASVSSFKHPREQSKFDTQSLQASRHRGRGRPALTRAASCRAGSESRSQPGQSPTDSSSGSYSMKDAPLLGHGGRPTLERANSCEGELSYWHKSGDVDRDEMNSLHANSYRAEGAGRVPLRSGTSLGSRRPKPDDGKWLAKQISQRSLSGLRTSSHHDPPSMDADEMESSSSGESFGGDFESGFESHGGESVADARGEPSVAQSDDDHAEFETHGVAGLRTSSHHDPPAMNVDEMESSSSRESFGGNLESGFEGYRGESVVHAHEEPSVVQSDDDQAEFETHGLAALGTSSHHDPPAMNADELISSPSGESFGGDFESGFEAYGESMADAHEEFSLVQSDDNQGELETHEVAALRSSSHHDPPAMNVDEMESSSSREFFGGTFESGFERYGESVADAHEEPSVAHSEDDEQGKFETHEVAAAGGNRPSYVQQDEDEESLSHGERGSSGLLITDLEARTTSSLSSSSSESENFPTDSDDWELENRLLSDNEEDCDSSLTSNKCDSNLQHVQSQQQESNRRRLFSKSNSAPSLRGSKPALHCSPSSQDRGIVPPRRAPSFGKKRNKDEQLKATRASSVEQLIRPDADEEFVVATIRGSNFCHGRDNSARDGARSCASSKNDSGIAPPRRAPSFGKKRNKDERPKVTRASPAEQLIRLDADTAFVVATMRGSTFYHGRDDSARSQVRSCASSKNESGIAPPRRAPSFGKKRNKDERPEVTKAASAEERIRPDADQELVVPMRVSHFYHGRDDSAQDEARRACASFRKERGITPPRRAPSFGKKRNKDERPKFTRAASAEQLMRSDADQVLLVPMRVSSFYHGRDDSARCEARSCPSSTKDSGFAPPRREPSSEEKTKKDERPKVDRAALAEYLIQPAAGQTQEIVVPVGGNHSCDGRYASSRVEESLPSCPATLSSTDGDVWLARYISRRSLTDMCRNSSQCEPPAMDPDEIDYSSSESSFECDMIFEFEQKEAKETCVVDVAAQESGEKSVTKSLAHQIRLRNDSEQEVAVRHRMEPEESKPPPYGRCHKEEVRRTVDKDSTDELSHRKDLIRSDAALESVESKSIANYMISEEETLESSTKPTTKDVSATADGVDPRQKAEMVSTVSQRESEGGKNRNSGVNSEESMISLVPEEVSPEIGRDAQARMLPIDDQSYSRQRQNIPQYLTCDTNSQNQQVQDDLTMVTFSERSRTIPFNTPDGQQMTLLFSAINYTVSVVPSVAMSTIGTSSSGQDHGSSAHSRKSKDAKMRIASAHSKISSETKKSKSFSTRSKKSKEMGQPKKAWKDLISSAYAHENTETITSSKRDKKQSLKTETKESECMYDDDKDLRDSASADLSTFLKASGDDLSETSKIAESAKTKSSKSSKHLKKKEKFHKKDGKDDKQDRTQKKEKKKEKHHHKDPKEEKKEHKHQKEEKKEKSEKKDKREKKENKHHKKDKEERKKDKKAMHKDDESVKMSKSKKKDTKRKEKARLSKAPSSEGTKCTYSTLSTFK